MPKKKEPDLRPPVGELVHYQSHGSKDGAYTSQCRPAIVTGVPTITRAPASRGVDLAVFNPTGMFFNRCLEDASAARTGGTWHWPAVCTGEAAPVPLADPEVLLAVEAQMQYEAPSPSSHPMVDGHGASRPPGRGATNIPD